MKHAPARGNSIQQRLGACEYVVDYIWRHPLHKARASFLERNDAQLRTHYYPLRFEAGAGQRHGKTVQPVKCCALSDGCDQT